MTAEYWTVGHDYDWHTPAELQVSDIAYATEELAVEAARRLLRYLLWQGCIERPGRIRYPWGHYGKYHWEGICEYSHVKHSDHRAGSMSEGRDGTTVVLDYTIDARTVTRRTETKHVEIDGETFTRKHEIVEFGPWFPLSGRAWGKEWKRLGGSLRAYIGRVEITAELPELSALG